MEKFIYTSSEELYAELLAKGCKFICKKEFNGELMYVFLNDKYTMTEFKKIANNKFNKEQLFVTDKLFF